MSDISVYFNGHRYLVDLTNKKILEWNHNGWQSIDEDDDELTRGLPDAKKAGVLFAAVQKLTRVIEEFSK